MEILKSELPKEEGVFEYYLDLYRKLNNTVPDLIEQKVITDFSQIKRQKIVLGIMEEVHFYRVVVMN